MGIGEASEAFLSVLRLGALIKNYLSMNILNTERFRKNGRIVVVRVTLVVRGKVPLHPNLT